MNREEEKKIQDWETPKWHKDWGDPRIELALLKDLCLFIIKLDPSFSFEIDYIAEGYVAVEAYKKEKHIVDFQVVDQNLLKIGCFFSDGREVYLLKIQDIQKHI